MQKRIETSIKVRVNVYVDCLEISLNRLRVYECQPV